MTWFVRWFGDWLGRTLGVFVPSEVTPSERTVHVVARSRSVVVLERSRTVETTPGET